ncbi:ChaB family protein [Leptolyngbya sp. FACHB-261]|uniref:ChaB family protein n=1 Tax=Leptolyngbya sp. FACHB-261 TaxID=2692806 RepID=UPI001688CA36|nr:ChaB family protein [Leptolyngbya sp. FACHB-261]MBD2102914.1 ChaB family protein [Leptolyngbya sp. FACHB-261]
MPYQQLSELPADVQALPQYAQQLFMAAFNSAESDSNNQESAVEIAWTTVKHEYEKGEDGSWQRKPEGSKVDNSIR